MINAYNDDFYWYLEQSDKAGEILKILFDEGGKMPFCFFRT
jgi:hypothetical protein